MLKDLQSQIEWDPIMEDHAENMAVPERGIELFGEQGLADDDLLAELEELEALDAAKDLDGPIGTGAIDQAAAA